MSTRRGILSLIGLAPIAAAAVSVGGPASAGALLSRWGRPLGVLGGMRGATIIDGSTIRIGQIAASSIRADKLVVGRVADWGSARRLLMDGGTYRSASQEPSPIDLEAIGALSLGG